MQYGSYTDNEFQKSYANLVDMKELPDSTKDRSVIRLLRNKNNDIHPFDSRGDHDFIRRFMESYYQDQRKQHVEKEMSSGVSNYLFNELKEKDEDEIKEIEKIEKAFEE